MEDLQSTTLYPKPYIFSQNDFSKNTNTKLKNFLIFEIWRGIEKKMIFIPSMQNEFEVVLCFWIIPLIHFLLILNFIIVNFRFYEKIPALPQKTCYYSYLYFPPVFSRIYSVSNSKTASCTIFYWMNGKFVS